MRPKWQEISLRSWEQLSSEWLAHASALPMSVSRPVPGIEGLPQMKQFATLTKAETVPDVDGLRVNMLTEALYLYHKAGHTQLAVARLSNAGMTNWAAFNAYHSALLSAKSIMAFLGVGFPKIGAQAMVDIFPEPSRPSSKRVVAVQGKFNEFRFVPLGRQLEQRFVWEAFQRVVRQTKKAWADSDLQGQILDLDWEEITPPRNDYLYRPDYWPQMNDLEVDVCVADWAGYMGPDLDVSSEGFLCMLSMVTHSMAEWLVDSLAEKSNAFLGQAQASRWSKTPEAVAWPGLAAMKQRAQGLAA